MDKINIFNTSNQQKYIRIRIIDLGLLALNVYVDTSLFNDMQRYGVIKEKDIDDENLKYFIDDSDIVVLVADMDDDFAVENILKITEFLSDQKKLFVTLLANIDLSQDRMAWILKNVQQKSSVLIVENQEDIDISSGITKHQKFTRIISELCDFIDEEIQEIRMLDDFFSSLINMNRFFYQNYELFLFVNYTKKQFEKIEIPLEESSQIWIRCPFDEADNAEVINFIEFIEMKANEDAPIFISNKTNRNTTEMEFTILLAVSNSV